MNTKRKHTKKRNNRKARPNVSQLNTVYTDNEYNSNDGMLTSVWGPGMWHYLHTMSFNYPVNPTKKDKEHYSKFMLQLKHVLPCGKCRKNLKQNYKKLPLYMKHMKNRAMFFSKYVFDLHELINNMLGKKSGLNYETIRENVTSILELGVLLANKIKPKNVFIFLIKIRYLLKKGVLNRCMVKNLNVFYK